MKVVQLCPTEKVSWDLLGFSLLQGNLSNPGIKSRSPALQSDSLPTELQGSPVSGRDSKGCRGINLCFGVRQTWDHLSLFWKMERHLHRPQCFLLYLFIFGCARSSLLCTRLSLVVASGSCCLDGVRGLLLAVASLVVVHGLQGTWAQEFQLTGCRVWAQ